MHDRGPEYHQSGTTRRGVVQLEEAEALEAALASVEDHDAAIRLQRLADSDIVLRLQLQSFAADSDDWKECASALIEYGYPVFMAWTVTGVIRSTAANHAGGRGVYGLARIPEGFRLAEPDAHDFVMDLLIASVDDFRTKTLMRHKWDASGGASLKTFFVGRALMSLPGVYSRWSRQRSTLHAVPLDELGPDAAQSSQQVEATVLAGVALSEVLPAGSSSRPNLVRLMFELQDAGFSLNEIAEVLTEAGYPQTEGSIRTQMSRARSRARRN